MKKMTKMVLGLVILCSLYANGTKLEADPPVITLEQHIQRIFGSKAKVALAVLKHESNLKLDAINYNCIYNGRSTFCKPKDKEKAWSVDCGIGQANFKGRICPPKTLTLEGNMEVIEKIYREQGLNAWVSYKSGAYKKFL